MSVDIVSVTAVYTVSVALPMAVIPSAVLFWILIARNRDTILDAGQKWMIYGVMLLSTTLLSAAFKVTSIMYKSDIISAFSSLQSFGDQTKLLTLIIVYLVGRFVLINVNARSVS